jgi:hypothetical protein
MCCPDRKRGIAPQSLEKFWLIRERIYRVNITFKGVFQNYEKLTHSVVSQLSLTISILANSQSHVPLLLSNLYDKNHMSSWIKR